MIDKLKKLLIPVLVSFLFITPAYSGTYQDIDYLIVDNTVTPWGHKFARVFQEIWKSPSGIKGYFIEIGEERVSVRQSWLYIKVGDTIFKYKVYEVLLKPTMSDSDMERLALTAAKRSLRFLLEKYIVLKSYESEL